MIGSSLQLITARVTVEMNEALKKEISREEIEAAVQQMGPLKSTRPDGLTYFFQNFWSIVGDQVCNLLKKNLGERE